MKKINILMRSFSFLLFYTVFYFLGIAGGADKSEYVENIRRVVAGKANIHGQKGAVAGHLDVTTPTLNKFINADTTLSKNSLDKIIKNFKEKYPKDYENCCAAAVEAKPKVKKELESSASAAQDQAVEPYSILNFSALPFGASFPEAYSLFMINSGALSPSEKRNQNWDKYSVFKQIGPSCLRPDIAENENVSFAETIDGVGEKNQWIVADKKNISLVNGKKQPYHIVQLFKKKEQLKALSLIECLSGRKGNLAEGFELSGALVIFSYSEFSSMVYGFGHWDSLLNPNCIIPQWGLRVLTSSYLCNPDTVKSVKAAHYRASNPHSKKEKAADLQPIETFGLEVGSEELESISLMPNKSLITSHIIEGTDHLRFTVNPSDDHDFAKTALSLYQISSYFFHMTRAPAFGIHSRLKQFIDTEIVDEQVTAPLYSLLMGLFKQEEGGGFLFVNYDHLLKEMGSKKLRFGGNKKPSIFQALRSQDPIPTYIDVWKLTKDTRKTFETLRLFYSLPLEYEGRFYRFNRAHWYEVAQSRFNSIKTILRQSKQDCANFHLPLYGVEDTKRSNGIKKADYKEAKYNLRAVQEINKKKGWEAILLDRLNIYWDKNSHKFEFADLLIKNKNTFYVVHVKRAGASDLSHHREQVERSADFLTSELNKKNADTLLLQGVINELYEENGLPLKKSKGQGKRLTKGNTFLIPSGSRNPWNRLNIIIQEKTGGKLLKKFKEQIRNINRNFFENHPCDLSIALDALYDCVLHTGKQLPDDTVQNFLEAVKQAVEIKCFLFKDGSLKKEDLKKIKIVMAVVDDRSVEAELQDKKTNIQNPIFKNQDLWGLDRTRGMVEKVGLGFILTVVNENITETLDAFGDKIKREEEGAIYEPSVEPECVFKEESRFLKVKNEPPKDLRKIFENTEYSVDELNLSISQKLVYKHSKTEVFEYLTCPTIGDGDCFFHAVFTKHNESGSDVTAKAAQMREELYCKTDEYMENLRALVYEHYTGLLGENENDRTVPELFRKKVKKKNEYINTYNGMQKFGLIAEDTQKPEEKFSDNLMKSFISDDEVKAYMERFRKVNGLDSYIPFRGEGVTCVASILADITEKQINIFTFDERKNRLNFIKTAGTKGDIISILHDGEHFVRLYDYSKRKKSSQLDCQQIIANSDF